MKLLLSPFVEKLFHALLSLLVGNSFGRLKANKGHLRRKMSPSRSRRQPGVGASRAASSTSSTCLSHLLLLCCCLCFQESSARLRINVLDVPEVVQSGHSVPLTCDYDLGREKLYSIKWYKGKHEFYRYMPTEKGIKKKQVFSAKDLYVDAGKSDERTVMLRNLHIDMTGTFRCEVSVERTFETISKSANMTVVALPREGPIIQIQGSLFNDSPNEVHLGEELSVNCTSIRSKPAAELSFYINNRKVSGRRSISLDSSVFVNDNERPRMESTFLHMHFKVRKHHVHEGRIYIRCVATILNAYRKDKTVELFVKTAKASNLTNDHGLACLAVAPWGLFTLASALSVSLHFLL